MDVYVVAVSMDWQKSGKVIFRVDDPFFAGAEDCPSADDFVRSFLIPCSFVFTVFGKQSNSRVSLYTLFSTYSYTIPSMFIEP